MSEFASMGIEEMRFVRLPYNGRAPLGFNDTVKSRSDTDFTNNTQHCMIAAHARRSMRDMFACWSSASAFDNFPKSADFAGVCPFHYTHWSCEGGKNGGRDHASRPIPRCRYVKCSRSTALVHCLASFLIFPAYPHLFTLRRTLRNVRFFAPFYSLSRCKVSFDMQNGFAFRPFTDKCHLLHFNDNKYRFQSRREKHLYDLGSVQEPCPIHKMYV